MTFSPTNRLCLYIVLHGSAPHQRGTALARIDDRDFVLKAARQAILEAQRDADGVLAELLIAIPELDPNHSPEPNVASPDDDVPDAETTETDPPKHFQTPTPTILH